MKLYLPHREANLDTTLDYDKRNECIHAILEEEVEFHSETMTVEDYFRRTWNDKTTKVLMDVIGYYLTKNNTVGEDREVLSNYKQKEMRVGSKRMITFSGMEIGDQLSYGITEVDDYTH